MIELDNKFNCGDTAYYNYEAWTVDALFVNNDDNLFLGKPRIRYRIRKVGGDMVTVDEDELYTKVEVDVKMGFDKYKDFKVNDFVRNKIDGSINKILELVTMDGKPSAKLGLNYPDDFVEYASLDNLEHYGYMIEIQYNPRYRFNSGDIVEFAFNKDGKQHTIYKKVKMDDYTFAILDGPLKEDNSNCVRINCLRHPDEWQVGDECYDHQHQAFMRIKKIDNENRMATLEGDPYKEGLNKVVTVSYNYMTKSLGQDY